MKKKVIKHSPAIVVSEDTINRLNDKHFMPPVVTHMGTWKCNALPDRYITRPQGIELRRADSTELILRGVIGPAVAADKRMAKSFDEQNVVGIWIQNDDIAQLAACSEN